MATEFQARAGIAEAAPPWPLGVPAARVAEAGYRGLMRGQRVVVPGFANRLSPRWWRDWCRAASCWRSSMRGSRSAEPEHSLEAAAYRSCTAGLAIADSTS